MSLVAQRVNEILVLLPNMVFESFASAESGSIEMYRAQCQRFAHYRLGLLKQIGSAEYLSVSFNPHCSNQVEQ